MLQSFYKIYAALIKERIAAGIDTWISPTQYGFRKGKSTAHALFITRRLLDIAETENRNLTLIMLDWEKAFDKVVHEAVFNGLESSCIDAASIAAIKQLYSGQHAFIDLGTGARSRMEGY